MMLSKTYSPQSVEKKWYSLWEKEGYFKPKKKENPYTIVLPPPNVTGVLHSGHALNITLQDSLIRYKRMKGFDALFLPGMDHAGIATQSVVEGQIHAREKKTRHELGREEFLKRVWEWKEKHEHIINEQQKAMGASLDWDRYLFTMDDEAKEAVEKAFVDYYNKGLIYKANRMINWDTVLQSAISDAEVEYKEVNGFFYHIHYRLKDKDISVEIATTRPETLLGDTAVCIHPEDKRFSHLKGETVIVPICNREIPVILDTYVDKDKGTGVLKVTPGHDFNDFDIGERHNLPVVNILNPDGTLNENASIFQGMDIKTARKKIVGELKKNGQMGKITKLVHQVGHGQRSGHPVEPIISKQWFLNVEEMASEAVKKVRSKETCFFPASWENTYFSWLDKPKDWCISRQLWWGHRIPFYSCSSCHHEWADKKDPSRCEKCSSEDISRDPDVLDTWFSSGLWPLATLGWPDKNKMKEKGFDHFFPTDVLVTGFDIIFFWVARMMMMSLESRESIPFKKVYIHAIVRDKLGRKMSKSLGNGIDPMEMIKTYGTDAFRFTLAAGSGYNRTLNLDPDVISGYRNFINKIWNAFRFIHPWLKNAGEWDSVKEKADHHERWILSELNEISRKVNMSFDRFRFDEIASLIYNFTYEKYCSWFIEISKDVLKTPGDACTRRIHILKFCFKKMMALLHPIAPFVTEEIWSHLKEKQEDLLIVQSYPDFDENLVYESDRMFMNKFIDIITTIRFLRASVHIKPKTEIDVFLKTKDTSLLNYLKDNTNHFRSLARVKKIHFDGNVTEKTISAPSGSVEIFIPVEGVVDLKEQIDRLSKQLNQIANEYKKTSSKLTNDNFIKKAPEEIVAEVRKKQQLNREKMESIESLLKQLK